MDSKALLVATTVEGDTSFFQEHPPNFEPDVIRDAQFYRRDREQSLIDQTAINPEQINTILQNISYVTPEMTAQILDEFAKDIVDNSAVTKVQLVTLDEGSGKWYSGEIKKRIEGISTLTVLDTITSDKVSPVEDTAYVIVDDMALYGDQLVLAVGEMEERGIAAASINMYLIGITNKALKRFGDDGRERIIYKYKIPTISEIYADILDSNPFNSKIERDMVLTIVNNKVPDRFPGVLLATIIDEYTAVPWRTRQN